MTRLRQASAWRKKNESTTNDETRKVKFRHSAFVIRTSSFLFSAIFPTALQAEENVSVLGSKPKWSVLEKYQETITHDEFNRLIHDVYCTHGFASDLIEVSAKTAHVLIDRDSQKFFTLRFAVNNAGRKPVPHLWRPAKSLSPARADKPLVGLKVVLDPGHLGGKWAKMEERWFQVDKSRPVQEGDLTFRVARLLAPRVRELGAKGSLIPSSRGPGTAKRPDDF